MAGSKEKTSQDSKNDKLSHPEKLQDNQISDQVKKIWEKHPEQLKKLDLTKEELSDASKDPESLKKLINNLAKKAQEKNLIDFKKGDEDKKIKTFGEAQKSNNDNVRGQIEENWQAAKLEDPVMRMIFETLNNLLKSLLHAGATVSYAHTVRQQKAANANQERENRSNKQQSFSKINKGNVRQVVKPKTPETNVRQVVKPKTPETPKPQKVQPEKKQPQQQQSKTRVML